MSVVGFDIGNDNCVAAAAKNRGIDVLLNHESGRQTPSLVSFSGKQRLIGTSAASSLLINPRNTISNLKRLLSPNPRPDELSSLPFPVDLDSGGRIGIRVTYMGEERVFSPVQVLAMLLVHLKQMAQHALGSTVEDCVIGIPCYFTDSERRGYLDAARIAGLRPLRLMHEGAATALGYGIYKTDFASAAADGAGSIVVFVDVGHCATQVTVVEFAAGTMTVRAHAFDRDLGGRDFDEVLFRHFAEQFKLNYNIDVYSNARACVRLRTTCEKLKKVLSANAEAPLNIECLMDERDVKGFIKREEFEKLSSGLLERIVIPCKKAMTDARITCDMIHSVELIGSGSRIPAISKFVGDFFRREPSRTLNASECIARGCALQCAMLSLTYKVKNYEVLDLFPFSVGFLTDESPNSLLPSNTIFSKGHLIPSTKILNVHRSKTFMMEFGYGDQSDPSASPKISCFKVGPFHSQNEKPKVKLRVGLNLHGILTVDSAFLIEDGVNDLVPRAAPHSGEDSEVQEFVSSASVGGVDVSDGSSFVKPMPHYSSTEGPARHFTGVDAMRQKQISQRQPILVSEIISGGMSESEMFGAQALENQLAVQDRIVEQTKDRKNALEAYVYDTRNKLFERYRSFTNESEKEGITRNLQQTEDWLYDEGDDESENVYSRKMEELKMLVDPIENRCKEEEARAQAMRQLMNCIVDHRLKADSLIKPDRDAVLKECSKADQWLRDKKQQQDSLPRNTDPVLWSSDIEKTMEELEMSCRHILRSKSSPPRTEDFQSSTSSHSPDNMETD